MYAIIKINNRTKSINHILGYVENLHKAQNLSDDLNCCLSGQDAKVYSIIFQKINQIG